MVPRVKGGRCPHSAEMTGGPQGSLEMVKVKAAQSCLTLCDPMDYTFSRPEYWSGQPFPSPGDLPNPGMEPRSPSLQADSLPADSQRKPKNTEVGNLFLLQRIFRTQESNWGLLPCRQILYQLSYQRSPKSLEMAEIPYPVSSNWCSHFQEAYILACSVGSVLSNPLQPCGL